GGGVGGRGREKKTATVVGAILLAVPIKVGRCTEMTIVDVATRASMGRSPNPDIEDAAIERIVHAAPARCGRPAGQRRAREMNCRADQRQAGGAQQHRKLVLIVDPPIGQGTARGGPLPALFLLDERPVVDGGGRGPPPGTD